MEGKNNFKAENLIPDNAMEQEQKQQPEAVEIEEQELDLADYPLDDIMIRNQQLSIRQVVDEIKDGLYILDPDFQREFVWSPEQQSRLIESVLMRIPLPVFYFAETKDGKTIVVDGLQRITTFCRFINDEFKLTHVADGNSSLRGKTFSELEPKFKNRINRTNLILYIIDEKAPERAKLDIFERVNSGSTLTRQQMRNSLYMGDGTRWLRDMSRTDVFQKATGGSLNSKTMRDRELINRFCAFRLLRAKNYKGYMDDFLAESLNIMNKMDEIELAYLTDEFTQSMHGAILVFGKHAFRKHVKRKTNRSVINASLFDIYSVAFSRISLSTIKEHRKEIHELFYMSMEDEEFNNSITYSTNERRQVTARFHYIDTILGEYYD
jgi:Protein of unknown function DUF262